MDKLAFVFAGQGSQYTGMGRELYEISPAAKAVFDMADSIRPGTSAQCFAAPASELSITINTQPCLFTVDLACAAAAEEAGLHARCAAGFSLGEMPALAFSGILTPQQALMLTLKRAEYMQQCTLEQPGAMAAIMGLSNEAIEKLCSGFNNVYPANYNCPGQLVVAGAEYELTDFIKEVTGSGGKAIKLNVSGAFHSPFMQAASKQLYDTIADYPFLQPKQALYSNVTGKCYGDDTAKLISSQLMSPVQWQKTVESMVSDGCNCFIEMGPGKTLTRLINKIDRSVRTYNIENINSLRNTVNAISGGNNA